MRFFLDNDTDARVRTWLVAHDHDAWTAAEAMIARARDDTLSVYADEHHAVLITHDAEFTERRKRNTIGRHVRLCCAQPDAVALLEARFDAGLVAALEHNQHITVELHPAQAFYFFAWQ